MCPALSWVPSSVEHNSNRGKEMINKKDQFRLSIIRVMRHNIEKKIANF